MIIGVLFKEDIMKKTGKSLIAVLMILAMLTTFAPIYAVEDEADTEQTVTETTEDSYIPQDFSYTVKASDGSYFTLTNPKVYGNEPELTCNAALLYEANSKQIIFTKNADKRIYPASTTKLMTALLAVENCGLNDKVTVAKSALDQVPRYSSIAGLKAGEEMTLEDMLKCLLVPSGNDAANVIAEHVAGSVDAFVEMMNKRAAELGCKDTNYANPSGFHDENHYTTAADLLIVTIEALKYPIISEICGSAQVTVPANDVVTEERIFNNTNYLISRHKTSEYIYTNATGLKTGSTTPAGQCLIGTAKKGDISLVSVVMGAQSVENASGTKLMQFIETKKLFEWGFNNFVKKDIISTSDILAEVKVELALDKDYVVLHPEKSMSELMHRYEDTDDAQIDIVVEESIVAPVKKGDVLGYADITFNGKKYDRVNLLAMNNVEMSDVLYYIDEAEQVVSQPWVKIVVLIVIAVIIIFIIYMLIYNNRRRKRAERMRRKRYYR